MTKLNIKFFPFLLGVYMGSAMLMFIDAWISVSLINMNDPSTWPHMHPWIRIYFIPIIGTAFAVIASIIELIRNFIWKTQIKRFGLWFVLGMSYTIILGFLALGRILPIKWAFLSMGLLIIFFNPFLIHYHFGRIKHDKV